MNLGIGLSALGAAIVLAFAGIRIRKWWKTLPD
jgi:hypothetical protein